MGRAVSSLLRWRVRQAERMLPRPRCTPEPAAPRLSMPPRPAPLIFERSRTASACRLLGALTLVFAVLGFLGFYFVGSQTQALGAALPIALGVLFAGAVSATFLYAAAQHLDRQDEMTIALRAVVAQLGSEAPDATPVLTAVPARAAARPRDWR